MRIIIAAVVIIVKSITYLRCDVKGFFAVVVCQCSLSISSDTNDPNILCWLVASLYVGINLELQKRKQY